MMKKNTRKGIILFFSFILLFSYFPNILAEETATKIVYVNDTEGNPIEDAYIEIYNEDYSYYNVNWTDENGYASFTMPPGDYTIEVTKEGFDPYTHTFAINEGETLYNNISLEVNNPPIANDDSASTPRNINVKIDVLSNDYDIDGDELNIISVSTPSHGTATTDGDYVYYTPDPDYDGEDSFTYTISDGVATSTATVNIDVYVPEISIIPSLTVVNKSEEFTVDIVVDAENILIVQCYLEFDATLLEAINVENGEMFDILSSNGTIDNMNGRIDNILGLSNSSVNGGVFAKITFKAKDAGIAYINFIQEANLVVGEGGNYSLIFNNANVCIDINPANLWIEPSYNITKDKTTVDIWLDTNESEVAIIGFYVVFDKEIFSTQNVTNGGLFSNFTYFPIDDGVGGIVAWEWNGTISVVNGSGVVAKIEFEAIKTGESVVKITNVDSFPYLCFITQDAILEADLTPPETTLTFGTPYYTDGTNHWINSSTQITLNATDVGSGVDKIYYYIDDLPAIEYTEPFTVPDGEHTIYYYAVDNVGNAEETNSIDVKVDNSPPVTTLTFGEPYYTDGIHHWITSSTLITLTATDVGSGVDKIYYYIDDLPAIEYTEPFTISDECNHTIYYYAVDNLGNAEETKSIDVKVDNSPPVTTLTFGEPYYTDGTNHWITSSTEITLNAVDYPDCASGVAGIWYSFDNVNWTEYTGPFTISEDCTIYYYSIDNLGNEEEHNSLVVYIDETPPTSSATLDGTLGDNNWYRSNVIVNLTANDEGSGVDKIYYKIGTGAWIEYTAPFTVSNEGQTTIYYYSIDNLENNETEKNVSMKIDKSPPSASHSLAGTIVDGKYTTDVIITFTASDTVSGVREIRYKVDGTSYTIYGSSGSDTVSSEGNHVVEYYALDNAGNVGSTSTFSFTIQKNKPPVANFTYSPLQPYDTDTITFADRSTDEDGEIVNYTWDFGDGNESYAQNPTHKYADNGTYIVRLTVRDDRNATSSTQQIIEVRNKPPTALISYSPDKPKPKEDINFTSLSTDEDGEIVNYTWDFGDGNISHERNPIHAYEKEGTYNVTLIVRDNDGDAEEKTIQIEVKAEKINVWLYLLIIIILIIIAIAVFAIWKRRSKGEEKKPEKKEEKKTGK
ncbi:MAG: PKD domain-containing protein [Thermoplasmatales archaeon]|nr:PKD domain-containing protein [Thermoplasmatales archaeon]